MALSIKATSYMKTFFLSNQFIQQHNPDTKDKCNCLPMLVVPNTVLLCNSPKCMVKLLTALPTVRLRRPTFDGHLKT